MARNIGTLVLQAAVNGAGGVATVPNTMRARADLKTAIWQRAVKPYYIGSGDDPFRDTQPQSPFARLLYDGVSGAVRLQVERQSAMLSRMIRDRQVLLWLTGSRPRFITEQRGVYDPFHTWVDPNGYRLSDRVWRTSIDVRTRIDRLLDYEIGRGTQATRIAALLEDFLTPGASLIKTNTPYGREGAFAARRLARTEITAAAGHATVNASIANPFVNGVRWRLSAAHHDSDQCDENARGGRNGDGIYPPNAVPQYPNHPHEKCSLVPVPVGDTATLVEDLRRQIYTNTPFARMLQGLMNPEFLHQSILDGSIGDVVRRLIATQELPTVATVATAAQPAAQAFDLSHGAGIRKRIGSRFDELTKEEFALLDQIEGLTKQIAAGRDEFNALIDAAPTPAEQTAIMDRRLDAMRPLQQARKAVYDRLDAIQAERKIVIQTQLTVPKAQRSKITTDESPIFRGKKGVGDMRKRVKASLDFVQDVTADVETNIFISFDATGRASASPGYINISVGEAERTIIHEIGHNIEYTRGASFRAKRVAFFEQRTAGDPLEKLKDVTGIDAYRDDEIIKRDKWLDKYMGKVYAHDSDQRASSEIISIGIEELFVSPGRLIKDDPEFFDFIVSYLHGRL